MLRAIAGRRGLSATLVARPAAVLAPTSLLTRRSALADDRLSVVQPRSLSSKAALSKMGTLSVDPLASNSTVQGVEYVLTGFDKLVNWARKSSMWPMTFGLA
jgi:hypothetical protein